MVWNFKDKFQPLKIAKKLSPKAIFLRNASDVNHKAELIPSRYSFRVAARDQKGAFIRKRTYEVDIAKSVELLIEDNTELPRSAGGV